MTSVYICGNCFYYTTKLDYSDHDILIFIGRTSLKLLCMNCKNNHIIEIEPGQAELVRILYG
jgi:hypothetical protein